MKNFNEKEMSVFLLKEIDEYAKNHTPMIFFAVEGEKLGSILEKRKYIMWFHSICLKQYLSKKASEYLKGNHMVLYNRFFHKFEDENREKIHSLSESLATETLSLTSKS